MKPISKAVSESVNTPLFNDDRYVSYLESDGMAFSAIVSEMEANDPNRMNRDIGIMGLLTRCNLTPQERNELTLKEYN